MSMWISLANNVAVTLFGSVLSAAFCDALKTKKDRWVFWCFMLALPFAQRWIYAVWDAEFLRQIYPLLVHLPLLAVLYVLTRRLLWPLFSVLTAYLCTQLRRWLALVMVAALGGDKMMQNIVQIVLTLPLLLLLLRFFAPAVRRLIDQSRKRQCAFGLIPAVYYVFDYATSVYTDLLYSGGAAVVEFMPFVCCLAYVAFLLYHSVREQAEDRLRQVRKGLDMQLNQAVQEISALRESQTLASQYRHDLRHHLQYLSACIESGQTDQAQTYIHGICQEIEAQKVHHYCENETANLILSSFVGRAEKLGVGMTIRGGLPAFLLVSDSDLCVLLSNALENALHACEPIARSGRECGIDLQLYEREGKLFM